MVKNDKKVKKETADRLPKTETPKVEQPIAVEQKTEAPKPASGGNNTLKILLGCCLGCLVIVVLVVVGSLATGGLFLKNIALPFLKQAGQEMQREIKEQEGLKNLEKGRNIFEQMPTIAGSLKIGEEGTTIPANFPSDFPIYPGAKVTQGNAAEVAGRTGFYINLETSDPSTTVIDYYKTNLPKNSWTVSSTYNTNEATFLTVQKLPLNGLVTISTKAGKTNINIVLGEK